MSNAMDIFDRLVTGDTPSESEIDTLRKIIASVKSSTTYASIIEESEDDVRHLLQTTFEPLSCVRQVRVKGLMPGTTGKIMMPVDLRKILFQAGREWGFDCTSLQYVTKGRAISSLICTFFQDCDLYDRLEIDPRYLRKFGRQIEMTYTDAPYHNSTHVASVLQCLHMILTAGNVMEIITLWCEKNDSDTGLFLAAAYIAASGHDAGHRGLTNDFLIKSKDETACVFNDRSCNENYHCRTTWRILTESAVLRNLDDRALAFMRCIIMNCILKTDMRDHFHVLHDFEVLRMSNKEIGNVTLDDILTILGMAMKCADLAHLAKPWDEHQIWVKNLQEEMYRQGDKEKNFDLPVSAGMDRTKPGILQAQPSFIKAIALPLYDNMHSVFEKTLPLLSGVKSNLEKWQARQ